MTIQCCQCRKVRVEDRWVAPDPPIVRDEHVSHGYCPDCAATAMNEFARFRANRAASSPRPAALA